MNVRATNKKKKNRFQILKKYEKSVFYLKIVRPILLQEKEVGLQSALSSVTTARNTRCVKGFRTFKKVGC